MPGIEIIETALPEYVLEKADLAKVAQLWFAEDPSLREKFSRLARNAGVESRYFVLPYQKTLELGGLAQRAELYERHGSDLLGTALFRLLEKHRGDPREISHLICSSCSVPLIPSVDGMAVLNSPLDPHITRLPIFQSGCAGGVVSLALGAKLAALGKPVIVSSVELCSLVFHPDNHSGEQLVGASIFGDGAAAVLMTPGKGRLEIKDSMSFLIPGTRHLMGYDIRDDGLHLRLERELPGLLAEHAPAMIGRFLAKHNLTLPDIGHWLLHPGGKKIMDLFAERLGFEDAQYRWSREVLRDCGNLSSATIQFVLKRFLDSPESKAGGKAVILGIGPGLTLELILLEH